MTKKRSTYCLLSVLFVLVFTSMANAQYINQTAKIVENRTAKVLADPISIQKNKARQKFNSSKRSLRESARGGFKKSEKPLKPTLDKLIKDKESKQSLTDNSNRSRYVELLGHWWNMPNQAELDLAARIQAYKDSIASIEAEQFRETKRTWNDARAMTIFGWHPHWMGSMFQSYNYNLYNVVSYYSYDINPDNGLPQNPEVMWDFLASNFVSNAQQNGCSALLSVTCHGENNVARFLTQNPIAQRNFIDSLLFILDSVNADGIEINFNGVNAETKSDFVQFVQVVSKSVIKARGDTSFILMSVPPYDPDNNYDILRLQNFVDFFIVKGFDFHETPDGLKSIPLAPLNYSVLSPDYDLRTAVQKYINNIGPLNSDRLLLALPNYGIKWKTDAISEDILDMSTHTFSDIQFDYVFQALDSFKYPDAVVGYDSTIHTHYFKYNEYYDGINLDLGDKPHEITIYYEDTLSLARKYQFLQDARLGGIAIQSLGYDAGFERLERVLADEFTYINKPSDNYLAELNAQTTKSRSYGIYFLAVILYMAVFASIG